MKKITMQDIADQLNISKNSVSQALTGKSGVSEETRRMVIEKANELGYKYKGQPQSSLQPIQSEPKTIALIASEFAFSQTAFFGQIYLSVEKLIKQEGFRLLIQSITSDARDSLELPDFIENKSVNGIIILSHISTDYIKKVLDTDIPTILIDHHDPTLDVDAILTNNRFGAFKAIKHLIDLGHKNIGFMGDIDFSPSYQERMEGYLLALREYDCPIRDEWMITDLEESDESVWNALDSIEEQPTAWFCVNDGLGFYTLTTLQRKGYRVPTDISICNFDNGKLSNIVSPKITTMGIDLTYYGEKAIEQLLWRIKNPDQRTQEVLIPATLLVKESTAEVKK
ncbi:LacI family DNA-binding transcriptional regulator [Bacillus carboniphilus]|uniref:LacI family DNA-binding transcriptional regulator n=2 Tax=Bacillus carboniphilus TaxID=86663 RepID=A0ABP3FHN1_9BACI